MIPNEIKNRLVDARERADNPPSLHGVRADVRVAIERDYRALAAHLWAIDEWLRRVASVTMRS